VSVALVIQHALHMHHIILSSVACLTVTYFFPSLSQTARFLANSFENKVCVLIFSKLVSEEFLILRRIRGYVVKGTYIFLESTLCSCQILMKLKFSWQIFEKHWNIKFHENPSSGSWVVPCGQTDGRTDDRHDEANSRFLQFCHRA
jgi:hypothetical protein